VIRIWIFIKLAKTEVSNACLVHAVSLLWASLSTVGRHQNGVGAAGRHWPKPGLQFRMDTLLAAPASRCPVLSSAARDIAMRY